MTLAAHTAQELLEQLRRESLPEEVGGGLETLSIYQARVANYANAHNGWALQAGLWFNPPLSVEFAEGAVRLANVNERIGEILPTKPWGATHGITHT